jgi:hypothetical protein
MVTASLNTPLPVVYVSDRATETAADWEGAADTTQLLAVPHCGFFD